MTPEAKEDLKKNRQWLLKIYAEHDVDDFRRFIKAGKESRPNLAKFEDASNFVLSEILYEQKSKLPYLGALCEQARNHKRMKQIWRGVPRRQYPAAIRAAIKRDGVMPSCNFCRYLQNPHPTSGEACVNMGGVPSDVCCPGFTRLSKKAEKRA